MVKLQLYIFALLLQSYVFGFGCIKKMISPDSNNEGYIESPGYPEGYRPHICLMWYHAVFQRTKVSIDIMDLDFPSADHCRSNSSNKLIIGPHNRQLFCDVPLKDSDTKYEAIVTDFFYIFFIVSEVGMSGRGFRLHYKLDSSFDSAKISPKIFPFTPPIPPSTTTTAPTTTPTIRKSKEIHSPTFEGDPSPCFFSITDKTGVITLSQDILLRARRTKHCIWLLHSANFFDRSRTSVPMYSLQFQQFRFTSDHCSLKVYNGANENGRLVGDYTQISNPHYLNVYGRQVFLKLSFLDLGYFGRGNFTMKFQRQEVCLSGYSFCSDNESLCFPTHKRCDGEWDCPLSGADERGCSASCSKDKFPCGNTSAYCYLAKDRCNGKGACANYRDEQNCTPEQCSASKGLFLCRNKRCIYEKWRCDRTNDCEDGSDEQDCNRFSSPRLMMACVVGTLVSSLLLVLALSFAFRVYALRMRQQRGEPIVPHDSPMSRIEQDLLRRREPPPQYNEAMLTSRSYDEAYLELLNQGRVLENGSTTSPQDGSQIVSSTNLASSQGGRSSSSSSRSDRRRQRRRSRHLHRNLAIQQLQLQQHQQLAPHHFTEQPPSYSLEMPVENSTNLHLGPNDSSCSHELQTLPLSSSSIIPPPLEPVPPPYSLHNDLPSTSGSDDDDEDDEYIIGDSERDGEDCRLLGGSEEDEDEEGDTCLNMNMNMITSESAGLLNHHPNCTTSSNAVLSSSSSVMMSTELDQLSEAFDKEETEDNRDNVSDDVEDDKKDAEKENEDGCSSSPSSSSSSSSSRGDDDSPPLDNNSSEKLEPSTSSRSSSSSQGTPSERLCAATTTDQKRKKMEEEDDDDDCECILSAGVGMEEEDGEEEYDQTTSDVACLLAR